MALPTRTWVARWPRRWPYGPTWPWTAHPPPRLVPAIAPTIAAFTDCARKAASPAAASAARVGPHLHARRRGHGTSQATASSGATPRSFGSAAISASMQTCKGGIIYRTLIAQALRRFQALNGAHPMRALGHLPGFVRLHLADKMLSTVSAQSAKFIGLGRPFLTDRFHRNRAGRRHTLRRISAAGNVSPTATSAATLPAGRPAAASAAAMAALTCW